MSNHENIAACERFLSEFQFSRFRVTTHGVMVRIQVPHQEIQRFFEAAFRDTIVKEFKKLGFTYISLDLDDFTPRSNKKSDILLDEEEPI